MNPAPHDTRLWHLAAKMSPFGDVKPLCRALPLDLTREQWTLRKESVTCPQCRALIKPKETV